MTLAELQDLLARHAGSTLRLVLPDGAPVPVSFHVTEVGRVQKNFLDCGGVRRESVTCQLQVWLGEDFDHRIEAGKLAAILAKGVSAITPDDTSVPVEIEYEDRVISQYYEVAGHESGDAGVTLRLVHKHTACLAPELCGLPSGITIKGPVAGKSRCGPSGCC